jgi:hypothetical protein
MQCPKCHLINPETAQRCDCGYDFGSGTMKDSYARRAQSHQAFDPAAVCDCVKEILPSEIGRLPQRNDQELARKLARKQRRTWAGVSFVLAPIFAVYGFIDLSVVLPGPGWLALILAPVVFCYGLFSLLHIRTGDPRKPEVLFAWLLENSFLLTDSRERSAKEMWDYILPSTANRYDFCQSWLARLNPSGGRLTFLTPEAEELARTLNVDADKGISSLRVPLYSSRPEGYARVAEVTLWAVRSPREQWWVILHSKRCIEAGVEVAKRA